MSRTVETDVCIVGAGISAAMVAERLGERTTASITVVEAGQRTTPLDERFERRRRMLDYGENPYPNDHVDGLTGFGTLYRSMVVGGSAMHWGGAVPRFSPEDFRLRSLYGVGDDWPVNAEDLDPFYQEAEERMGVAGEQGPPEFDPRSKPYPMPPVPLGYNLERLREVAANADIPFWTQPWAKNTIPYQGRNVCQRCDTCSICPTGAKYTPDFALDRLIQAGRIELLERTVVRRLVLRATSDSVERAIAVNRDRPDEEMEIRARLFVLAAGHTWSPHLLLSSASERYPNGLGNQTDMVGRYMTGHWYVSAFLDLPLATFPGLFPSNSLLSRKFARPGPLDRYVRHDMRLWESTVGRGPRLRDDDGRLLLGDDLLADWRGRNGRSTARVRSYYDVLPDRDSRLTLDGQARSPWGDPLPRLTFIPHPVSADLRAHTEDTIRARFEAIASAGGGSIMGPPRSSDLFEHPGGGCRMGDDPNTSVVDSYGRTHDHENLFVVGAPTMVSGGCALTPGLQDVLSESLGVHIEQMDPLRRIGYREADFDPEWVQSIAPMLAVSVGLACRRVGD